MPRVFKFETGSKWEQLEKKVSQPSQLSPIHWQHYLEEKDQRYTLIEEQTVLEVIITIQKKLIIPTQIG